MRIVLSYQQDGHSKCKLDTSVSAAESALLALVEPDGPSSWWWMMLHGTRLTLLKDVVSDKAESWQPPGPLVQHG